MSTKLYNFINIFNATFKQDDDETTLKKIVIPIIQRDYAQGRKSKEVDRIRKRFLASLKNAVLSTPITLDFIYGDIDKDGTLIPLDGQQRLTTLFLLHWYVAKKENINNSEWQFLKNFTYETRYSARDFCGKLVDFTPSFCYKISEEITDQFWFPLDWNNDPTISSMLVMIDAIDEEFKNISSIWEKLKNDTITFYFLPIKDMGLTDELYIKMNSRGKPLTIFEHFKAELEHKINKTDTSKAKEIIQKTDQEWTDLLWQYRSEFNRTIDDKYLNFFRFICSVICYKNGDTMRGKSLDEFDLLSEYFSKNSKNINENINTLISCFDCLCNIDGYDSPANLFKQYFSHEHETNKILIDQRYKIDPFEECISSPGELRLPRFLFLYAIIVYLQNSNIISESVFVRRIRIINNLIRNSNDEISNNESRDGGNRIPNEMLQIEQVMLNGTIDMHIGQNFNVNQLNEEAEKIDWLKTNEDKAEALFRLEDHNLLHGQIGIIGLEKPELFSRFESLFKCDYDTIDCALMSIAFYGQQESNRWRYQLGSGSNDSSWDNLFHKSKNNSYSETKKALRILLSSNDTFTDKYLTGIKTRFINNCEQNSIFPFSYYYIKYNEFRPKKYGKYMWHDFNNSPYNVYVLCTKTNISENTYVPFLKALDNNHLSHKIYYGDVLVYEKMEITHNNNTFSIKTSDGLLTSIEIKQNSDDIDTENRIEKLKAFLSKNNIET